MIMLGKVLGVTKVDGKDNMVKLPKKVGDIVYFEEHWYESNSEAN
jgi:co-chaperonin GroES (HSP10)